MYHNILQRHDISSGLRLIKERLNFYLTFQEDNDPKYASKICINYLNSQKKSKLLRRMNWPPQLPNLNLMELLWDEFDRKAK